MISFRKMTEEEFCAFKKSSVADYAQDLMKGQNIPPKQALKDAETEFDGMLPNGLETQNHSLMKICDAESGKEVGWIWFQYDRDDDGAGFVFLNDFLIYEPARRKGYASSALREMNRLAKACGCKRSELFVWGHNPGGMRLYEACGYRSAGSKEGGTYMVLEL